MTNITLGTKKYRRYATTLTHYYEGIPTVVQALLASVKTQGFLSQSGPTPIPSLESAIQIIHRTRRIIFPGYFDQTPVDSFSLEHSLGNEMTALFEALSNQIVLSGQHYCLQSFQPCPECIELGHKTALQFVRALPHLKTILASDVRAALKGDPAAKNYDEIIFTYPGLFAITVYRMAHELHSLGVPLLPRVMTEYAHSRTGIDIHPGAKIGESFFIDHGTGVVVGETAEIGNRVRIYQGVTLGALSLPRNARDRFKNKKRHPTLEDDVIVYSNATILGGESVIGARSVIGGNVWLTESVPPDTKVHIKRPELVYTGNGSKSEAEPEKRIQK